MCAVVFDGLRASGRQQLAQAHSEPRLYRAVLLIRSRVRCRLRPHLATTAALALVAHAANLPWFPSLMASEHFDSGRTHLFETANFNGSFNRPNAVDALISPAADPYLTP